MYYNKTFAEYTTRVCLKPIYNCGRVLTFLVFHSFRLPLATTLYPARCSNNESNVQRLVCNILPTLSIYSVLPTEIRYFFT